MKWNVCCSPPPRPSTFHVTRGQCDAMDSGNKCTLFILFVSHLSVDDMSSRWIYVGRKKKLRLDIDHHMHHGLTISR